MDGQQVLCFSADEMPLIPNPQARNSQEERAYGRAAGHGTLVKLYGYDVPGIRSSVTGDTGLMKRMNTMIPRALMPIRFFDARGKRKWQTASGIQNDIEGRDGTDLAIEPHIVDSLPFVGNSLPLEIYAFERGAGAKYRVGTGQTILFTVNGQVHASRGSDFLKASRVNRSDVADDILIVVDCTALPERLKEDLFMNSRDRMQSGPLREQMETELASALHDNEPLSELNQRRRLQRVSDSKAAEEEISEVLESILRSEPRLLNALASGGKSGRFRNPAEHDSEFIGSMYPSYFRSVRPKAVDGEVNREVAVGSRLVLNFETDASDGYFGSGRGRVRVVDIESGEDVSGLFRRSGPNSGKCTISSADIIAGHQAGDLLGLEIIVEDDNPIPLSPFVCAVYVAIVDRSSESETSPSPRDPFTGKKLPHIEFVPRERWAELNGMHGFDFGPTTVIQARPTGTEGAVGSYDLYINVDNGHLEVQRRAKPSSADGRTFLWKRTTSLIGLALASYLVDNELPGEEVELVEERITEITSGLAPVLASLPEILAAGAVKDADSREPVQG
ncbi:MAG: hypothetical protein F4Y11_02045 [Chloroflexi bacterium]|nr:hypothetical protein [Chloroflexota bacterium]